MNAPAKRFSLQRLLTSPAPSPEPAPAPAPKAPDVLAVLPAVASVPEEPVAPASAPVAAAVPAPSPAAPRAAKAADAEESHPKKKRSYSVDMKLCEDLEILAWYQSRSSSSVVEELIRKHLQHQRSLLFKARDVWNAR
jgi:hypothetical protein